MQPEGKKCMYYATGLNSSMRNKHDYCEEEKKMNSTWESSTKVTFTLGLSNDDNKFINCRLVQSIMERKQHMEGKQAIGGSGLLTECEKYRVTGLE